MILQVRWEICTDFKKTILPFLFSDTEAPFPGAECLNILDSECLSQLQYLPI